MTADKYTALWLSHSSIGDYLKCPRAYYLKNVYKDPKTGHKIQLMMPPLALGQAVHEVLESLSNISTDKRFNEPLTKRFEESWKRVAGKKGGFVSEEAESKYKHRGEDMLRRVINNPGPLKNLAVKIKMDLPYYWLSEEDNIILCGKIDWLEYIPERDSIHIIDFKTSKSVEEPESLQLPIYNLLATHCQPRKVEKASYWYLEERDYPTPKDLPDIEESEKKIIALAKKIKLARKLDSLKCVNGEKGCDYCKPYEKVIKGDAEFVYTDDNNRDVYISNDKDNAPSDTSIIL